MSNKIEYLRLFIAIELPQGIKSRLKLFQDRLRQKGEGEVKWVEPANIHLTLKFLGNVEPTKTAGIEEALLPIASETLPFLLQIEGVGVFPNINNAQVIWLGVRGDLGKLLGLWHKVEEALAKLGFPRESRPFTPHLTLARIRERASKGWRRKLVKEIMSDEFEPLSFTADSFSLMRSQLTPSGPIYSRLFLFLFRKEC